MKKLKYKNKNRVKLEDFYSNYYKNNYINNKTSNNLIKTTDGIEVLFYGGNDPHSYTSIFKNTRSCKLRVFDFNRARRLNWIRPVIEEKFDKQVYKIDESNKRIYFVPDEKYIIVLRKNKKGKFVFESHYTISTNKKFLKFLLKFNLIK